MAARPVRHWWAFPERRSRLAGFRVARVAILVALLALALGALGGALWAGGRLLDLTPDLPLRTPSPISSVPAELEPTATEPATVIEERSGFIADVAYTSKRFESSVTFRTSARTAGGAEGDICAPATTSPRSIVLAHPKGCVEDLRFIRPWAVDCGAAGDHPDADTLAAAILTIPATASMTDFGDLQAAGAVPAGMFADRYHGRVIEMVGGGLFRADLPDRDHCRLLPEPGSDDPVIEIRRDMSALFVLVDVNDELVVIRASGAGHDTASGAEARSRGYARGQTEDSNRHLLGLVNGIRFTP